MFQRLEAALHSEIRSLGHPRAALLGFAVAVLAYNVLALLQRCIERAHQATHPTLQVSAYHLALQIRSGYEGMLIALPAEQWPAGDADPAVVVAHLIRLARNIVPHQVATSPPARAQTCREERLRRCRGRTGARRNRPRPRPGQRQKTLKGVVLKPVFEPGSPPSFHRTRTVVWAAREPAFARTG
jgi:hypothetical protein